MKPTIITTILLSTLVLITAAQLMEIPGNQAGEPPKTLTDVYITPEGCGFKHPLDSVHIGGGHNIVPVDIANTQIEERGKEDGMLILKCHAALEGRLLVGDKVFNGRDPGMPKCRCEMSEGVVESPLITSDWHQVINTKGQVSLVCRFDMVEHSAAPLTVEVY
jgi:hypothetical protein